MYSTFGFDVKKYKIRIIEKYKILVISIGYIGMPLTVEFIGKFPAIGFNNDMLSGSLLCSKVYSHGFIKPAAFLQEACQWPIDISNRLQNLEISEWQLS